MRAAKDEERQMKPATFDNLTVGDRVRHAVNGVGVVVAKGETVDVKFDHVGKNGQHWAGAYDRDWFRIVPTTLVKL
jgi:hypothetical protein